MKHKKYIIPFLLSSIFLLNACQKDIDKFVPDPVQPNQSDTNWVATITPAMEVSLLKSSLLLPVYTDSFFISSTTNSLLTSAGLNAMFTHNSLVNDSGQAVSGNIYLETLLLRKKGDMIRMDKPTTSNENILLSAGELLVRVKKDGMDVRLAQQNTISISYYDSLASTSMRLYYGDESNPLFFNWANNLDSAVNSVTAANRIYTIRTKTLGWIGVGKPIQNAGQANISLTLPAQFTNANTMAYLVNTNSLSVIKMKGDASIRKFTSSGLPFNSSFTAIIISKQGDNYYLGNQSFTTIPGTTNNVVVVSPTIKTPANIIAYLDAL